MDAAILGLVLGLSAGLSPGPLMALVMTQTLRHGRAAGIKVAFAPLLTDLPIVVLTVLLVDQLAGFDPLFGGISIVGAFFVGWLAWETFRAEPPAETAPGSLGETAPAPPTPPATRALLRAVFVNWLNPHPYLFWLTVGAPQLIRFAEGGLPVAALFLIAFYVGLVGSKIALALATAGARRYLLGGLYRWIMRGLAALLVLFGIVLLADGIALIAHAVQQAK